VEGAALFGFLTFFPAALEAEGLSRRLAGLVVALYGVATALLTRPARRLSAAWPVGRTLGVGLLLGAVALGIAGASRSPAAIGASAVVLAAGLALAHPLLQAWATTVLPAERATTVGLFATGLFVGTALTTQLVAPFVAELGFGWTFTIGAGMAAGLAGMLVVSWQRFERREQLPADGLLPAPERATDP
jgi:MFS family permease